MPSQTDGERPPMVEAMQWVSRITTVSLEMVLPGLAGHWLDGRWGTAPWFIVAGVILGFVVAIMHLLQMVGTATDTNKQNTNKRDKSF